jgi:hypothetical protein
MVAEKPKLLHLVDKVKCGLQVRHLNLAAEESFTPPTMLNLTAKEFERREAGGSLACLY